MKHFDVIISGAGMVGASIATALAAQKFSVLLLEARDLNALKPTDDYGLRVSAFTPSSKKWMQHVDAWNDIMRSARVAPFMHMYVWDGAGNGKLQFDAHTSKIEALGYIIDNAVVQAALLNRAQSFPEVSLLENTCIKHFSQQIPTIEVTLSNDECVSADLLIGADGGNSLVRELAGITCSGWSYGQKTIVGQVRTEISHENTCWQRFLKNGPIALLPLADGRCSLAWHTTHAEADALLALTPEEFSERMTSAFEGRLGKVEIAGELGAFPLRLNHARSYIKPNIALVGDAIHTIHPLAGLGVNLGFLDAATLVDELVRAKNSHTHIADINILKRYQRHRMAHNLLIMGAMDMFKRSSTNTNPIVKWTRNQGLNIVNHLPPLKSTMAKVAMGYYGCLPDSVKVS